MEEIQITKLIDFATGNGMNVTGYNDLTHILTIDGRPFMPILGIEQLFKSDMSLNVGDYARAEAEGTGADYVFEFGGNYYWSSRTSKAVQFNDFRYIGRCDQELDAERAHLGIHGGYEVMNGSGVYPAWCSKAKFLGHEALGICEHNTLAGAVAFQMACKDEGIKPVIGMSLDVTYGDWTGAIKVYAVDKSGWRNILRMHKVVNVDAMDNELDQTIELAQVLKLAEGVAIVVSWGSDVSPVASAIVNSGARVYYQIDSIVYDDTVNEISMLNNVRVYLEAYASKIPPILINDTYYIDKDYKHIKGTLNASSGKFARRVSNAHYKTGDETFTSLCDLFKEEDDRVFTLYEDSVNNLSKLIDDVSFKVETGVVRMPEFRCEDVLGKYQGHPDNESLIWAIIGDGIGELDKVTEDEADMEAYYQRVELEMDVIKRGGFIDYFLVVWDIINWSADNGIYTGLGRGSAGGSLISYLMGITKIDPLVYDLPFERFMNEGRLAGSLPDIDSDFEGLRRSDVKRYMESKYGVDYVCSVGSYSKLRVKAAMNEMWMDKSKKGTLKYMTAMIMDRDGDWDEIFKSANKKPKLKEFVLDNVDFINNVRLVLDQPKNTSIHAGAVVIVPKHDENGEPMTIYDWMPVTKRDGVLISEWEGTYIEKCGFLKNDILGTRQLDKFRYITDLIKETTGKEVSIYDIPTDDQQVFALMQEGYTEDSFHFGTKGLKAYTRTLKPVNFEDLIDTISLHRPALMDIGMHKEFVNIRFGRTEAKYDFMLREVTENTNGILVYQEQVMEAVKLIGGFTMQEADDVRRAMGKKKIEVITPYKKQFVTGAMERGLDEKGADELWAKLELFSGYGFNRCISGETTLKRLGTNAGREISVGDMWKCVNDLEWAKSNNKIALRKRYKSKGYGKCWSLSGGRLYKNNIVNISYAGFRETFTVTTESGATISVTNNHKFPTNNGEKKLSDINTGSDELYVDCGYGNEYKYASYTKDVNYRSKQSVKGKMGFQSVGGNSLSEVEELRKNAPSDCGRCCEPNKRIEVHHIDEDPSNNKEGNIEYLCPSCHKKEHYKNGGNRQGDVGLVTKFEKIISIVSNGEEDVYDIEMGEPNHTFTVNTGIVTCNSHATAYALTGYIGMWFKVNYPLQFWTAAFQYADDSDISAYVSEMHKVGTVAIAPPDINTSDGDFTTDYDTNTIYWSLNKIKQVGGVATDELMTDRDENGKYFSLEELFKRVTRKKVNRKVITSLIYAGCMDKLYNVKTASDRYKIFKEYAKLIDVSISELVNPEMASKPYWWTATQKIISGLGIFEWSEIFKDAGFDTRFKLLDSSEVALEESVGKKGAIGGIIVDYNVHKSVHGEFANVCIDNNDEIIWTTLWNDAWVMVKDELTTATTKQIMLLTGQITYSSFRGMNVMETYGKAKAVLVDTKIVGSSKS